MTQDTKKRTSSTVEEQFNELLAFIEFSNEFRRIERTIWFQGNSGRERDGEHSFQLALVAWFMNDRFELGYDSSLLIRYALVHDIVEVYAGDTPAFSDLFGNLPPSPTHATKKKRERVSRERIAREWEKRFPEMIALIEAYELREDKESRFIYGLDQLVSTINIYQDGGRTYKKLGITYEDVVHRFAKKITASENVEVFFRMVLKLLKEGGDTFFCKKRTRSGQ